MTATIERMPSPAVRGSMSLRDRGPYSARNSSKGALIDEAGRVCEAFATGLSADEVRRQVLEGVILNQRSHSNRDRIWSALTWRYLFAQPVWLLPNLIQAWQIGSHSVEFVSQLYLLYALRDRLTFDFVTQILADKQLSDRSVVSRHEVLDLLHAAALAQPQIDRWSETTRIKLAGSILTALRDFGVLEGHQKKRISRPLLPLSTAEVLLRILIAEGERGRSVLESSTWRLFLLTDHEVIATLSRLAQSGRIRFEKAGGTVVLETPASWEEST